MCPRRLRRQVQCLGARLFFFWMGSSFRGCLSSHLSRVWYEPASVHSNSLNDGFPSMVPAYVRRMSVTHVHPCTATKVHCRRLRRRGPTARCKAAQLQRGRPWLEQRRLWLHWELVQICEPAACWCGGLACGLAGWVRMRGALGDPPLSTSCPAIPS